ncbi:DEAD/DEAH box helicase [Asticcacaulis taihuensis]|uniref:DEAD/DEAH box helicase n=1 Tax=Asticcacaulis taihuensis TaxID=260084 RepID=UPI003F7BEBFC
MSNVLMVFESLLPDDLELVETLTMAPREERYRPIPKEYISGPLRSWLLDGVGVNGTLWSHQSLALELLYRGKNVVVATGTASGKSLIFQVAVAHEMLSSDGRALVLYPLKALLSDQLTRWRKLAKQLGLPENTVAELHGGVLPEKRDEAMRNARIIVATPDTVHAWLMRQVATPTIREFLRQLRFLILDEAHTYESVFGSNVAYLLRRLLAARRRVCKEKGLTRHLQIIGATATIADPAGHMEALTGWPFAIIGDEQDGSPSFGRTLLHIDGPDSGAAAESMLGDVCRRLANAATEGSFIAFHDSRQGVERVASAVDHDDVLPYRSGYEDQDRRQIERRLGSGQLRGVISTSALELGIDVKSFVVGMNLGVPQSRKQFRQRLGRVGRSSPGLFAIIAPRHTFSRFGSSFADYYAGSVEPSHLYLQNRFIQFAQARCLLDESEGLGIDIKEPPPGVTWPDGFREIYDLAKTGVRRPPEFDFVARLGADSPHINYPLRQVGEANYILKTRGGTGEDIGNIALNQAIREAYPGANYLHLRQPMHVLEWRNTSFDRSIRLEPARRGAPTRPMIRKTVNIGFGSDEIVAGRMMSHETGIFAEVLLQVNESVEGFRLGSTVNLYKDLRQQNPHMTRKQREFSTTGIIIKISEDWFSGGGTGPAQTRNAVANALSDLLKHERSVSPNDIDYASTNIAIYNNGAPKRATDTIVIYDSIYGGLRLTEPLFDELPQYLARLHKASDLAGDDAALSIEIVEKLRAWAMRLEHGSPAANDILVAPDGQFRIYSPGSIVSVMLNGVLSERKLLEPQLMPFGGEDILVYSYDTGGRGLGMIPHDQVQATGQDWSLSFWDPKTGAMTSVEQEEGFF